MSAALLGASTRKAASFAGRLSLNNEYALALGKSAEFWFSIRWAAIDLDWFPPSNNVTWNVYSVGPRIVCVWKSAPPESLAL